MKLRAIIDWLDDKINPIVVKELRQAVKSRMVVGILGLFLGLQLLILSFSLMAREVRGDAASLDWNAGLSVFQIQQSILLWTIMILVPAYTAIRLAAERSDHNVDLMYISTLRPSSIIWGKYFSALVLGLLIFSACAPFMTFCYLLRGIDIPTILTILGIDLLCMLFGISAALFLASIPGGRIAKFSVTFVGFVGLCLLCGTMNTMTVTLLWERGEFEFIFETWYVPAVIVTGILGFLGLLFFYCVAMSSSASSNRIMPLRIYLFVAWVLVFGALVLVSHKLPGGFSPLPLVLALILLTPFLGVQLWISICERDRWATRVARTIPRLLPLRMLAFLFYTGAAGGLALTTLLYILTLSVTAWHFDVFVGAGPVWEAADGILRIETALALYVYCYALSALLVRNHLLADQVKQAWTWIIGAVLLGLGSAIPSFAAYIIFYDQFRHPEPGWWVMPNPFWSLMEFGMRGQHEFQTQCFWFLGTWAALVTILSTGWFVTQVRRFHPLRRETEASSVIVLDKPQPVGAS